jgi:PspC domain-containing protein
MRDGNASTVLMRRRDGRMLAGVCAGVADYFGLDPDEGQQSSIAENIVGKKQDSYSS